MLYFDDDTVGGHNSPSDGSATYVGSRLTYHGLTFSSPNGMYLFNQNFVYGNGMSNNGDVSSPANNLATDSYTSAELAALTISTGSNGAIKIISLFVSSPSIHNQYITITGSQAGISSPGCSGTFTPNDGCWSHCAA